MTALYYQAQGQGAPLLLLHGLFGSSDNWGRIAAKLATAFQVISVDLRNHGRSPHTASHTYPEMADDIIELLDALALPSAHVLGHSMGGKVAMTVATRYPQRINHLVVVDMAMRAYPATYLPHIEAMLAVDLSPITSRREVDSALMAAIPDTQIRQFLLTNLIQHNQQYAWRFNLPTLKQQYPHIQAPVCCDLTSNLPCLFIHGAHSPYIQPHDIAQLQQHFSQAQFVSLPTGHWVHAEAPTLFTQAVMDFLGPN